MKDTKSPSPAVGETQLSPDDLRKSVVMDGLESLQHDLDHLPPDEIVARLLAITSAYTDPTSSVFDIKSPLTWRGNDEHAGKDTSTLIVGRPQPVGRELLEAMFWFCHYSIGDAIQAARAMRARGQISEIEASGYIIGAVLCHVQIDAVFEASPEGIRFRRDLDEAAQRAGYGDFEDWTVNHPEDEPKDSEVNVICDREPQQVANYAARLLEECNEPLLANIVRWNFDWAESFAAGAEHEIVGKDPAVISITGGVDGLVRVVNLPKWSDLREYPERHRGGASC